MCKRPASKTQGRSAPPQTDLIAELQVVADCHGHDANVLADSVPLHIEVA